MFQCRSVPYFQRARRPEQATLLGFFSFLAFLPSRLIFLNEREKLYIHTPIKNLAPETLLSPQGQQSNTPYHLPVPIYTFPTPDIINHTNHPPRKRPKSQFRLSTNYLATIQRLTSYHSRSQQPRLCSDLFANHGISQYSTHFGQYRRILVNKSLLANKYLVSLIVKYI